MEKEQKEEILESIGLPSFSPTIPGDERGKENFFKNFTDCYNQLKKDKLGDYAGNPAFFTKKFEIVPQVVSVLENHMVIYKRRQKTTKGGDDPLSPCEDSGLPIAKEGIPEWGNWHNACSGENISYVKEDSKKCFSGPFPGFSIAGWESPTSINQKIAHEGCAGFIPEGSKDRSIDLINKDIEKEKGLASNRSTRVKVEYKIENRNFSENGFTCKLISKKVSDYPENYVDNEMILTPRATSILLFGPGTITGVPYLVASKSSESDLEIINKMSEGIETEDLGKIAIKGGTMVISGEKKPFTIPTIRASKEELEDGRKWFSKQTLVTLDKKGFVEKNRDTRVKYIGNGMDGAVPYYCMVNVDKSLIVNTPFSDYLGTGFSTDHSEEVIYSINEQKSGVYVYHNEKFFKPEKVEKEFVDECNSFIPIIEDFSVVVKDVNQNEISFDDLLKLFDKK